VTLRASRLSGGSIAVSIEETPAAPRLDLFARAHAFTPREGELLRLLARGLDTRELGKAMRIKDFTVHDHLKSIFTKTSLNTRTAVLTAALGAADR
jgi:DNA-binding NarL/FixJ family response regulator